MRQPFFTVPKAFGEAVRRLPLGGPIVWANTSDRYVNGPLGLLAFFKAS